MWARLLCMTGHCQTELLSDPCMANEHLKLDRVKKSPKVIHKEQPCLCNVYFIRVR